MRIIDGKYQTTGEIQKRDGTPIPKDEPLMLFRGKDKVLPELLEKYNELCQAAGSPPAQIDRVSQYSRRIRDWQNQNPDKVKIPD